MPTKIIKFQIGLFLVAALCWAELGLAAPNATITQASVKLYQSFPTYRASTLLNFRLEPGPSLTTIPKGARVEAAARKIVGKKQEWFEIVYETNEKTHRGWMYAGDVGERKYLRLDRGVEERLTKSSRPMAPGAIDRHGLSFDVLPVLYAQDDDVAIPPPVETKTLPTLLLGLAHVAIFVGALFSTKRWIFPSSDLFSFLTSLGILVILGFLPASEFANLIGQLLT